MSVLQKSFVAIAVALLTTVPALAQGTPRSTQQKAKPGKEEIITWVIAFIREHGSRDTTNSGDENVTTSTSITKGDNIANLTIFSDHSIMKYEISAQNICKVHPPEERRILVDLKTNIDGSWRHSRGETELLEFVKFTIIMDTSENALRLVKALKDLCSYNCPKASGLY